MSKRKYRVEFAYKLYPLQQEIVDTLYGNIKNHHGEKYRFLEVILGRQSGKSFLAKYVALDCAINRDETVMWIAPSHDNARGHWNDLVKQVQESNIPTVRLSVQDKEIIFHGGGSIRVRSALEKDNLRGGSPDKILLDEAAFFEDGEYVWYSVLLPSITASRGSVLILTTPNGLNYVHDLYQLGQDPKNPYHKSWRLPSTVSPYQDKELLKELKKTMPSIRYREEILAEFIADGGGIFANLDNAASNDIQEIPDPHKIYVAGMDIGFSKDYSAFTVFEKYTGKQVFGTRFTDVGTISSIQRIINLLDIWKPEVTFVERNGVGEHFLTLLQEVASGNYNINDLTPKVYNGIREEHESFSDRTIRGHRIKGVHINNESKRSMVDRLAIAIEYGRASLLKSNTEYGKVQILEMSTFERVRTSSGINITYRAASNGHDDTVTAAYLAYSGVKDNPYVKVTRSKTNPFKKGGNLHAKRVKIRAPNRNF